MDLIHTIRNTCIVLMILALLMIAGCSQGKELPTGQIVGKDYCEVDANCICDGTDPDGGCFIGNKEYYNKHVDKSKDCPDFCKGISGNLVVKCIDNRCVQVFECIIDTDCDSGICEYNKCS